MWVRLIPVLLIGLAVGLYHAGTKGLGKSVGMGPWMMLALIYFTAFLVTLGISLLSSAEYALISWPSLRFAAPFVVLVALGCIGIEGGYLWAYRSGWNVTELMPFTALINSVVLVSIGAFFFREQVTLWNIVGLTLLVSGATLFRWS